MDKKYIELESKNGQKGDKVESFIEKKRYKEWKHSVVVRVCLTVVLVIFITISWVSLMSPLVVGYLTRHPTANISDHS